MELLRVNRGQPEQVYVIVRNTDSSTLTTGYAVFWDLPFATDSVGSLYDGVGVRFGNTATDGTLENPGAFAGIVARKDIASSAYGRVQVYGPVDSVVINGTTGAPFVGATAAWTEAASVSDLILRPIALHVGDTSATGMLGVMQMTTQQVTTVECRSLYPGGFVVPYSSQFTSVSTDLTWVAGTIDSTGTGWCKAFVRCL